jgi:hypothetical protein
MVMDMFLLFVPDMVVLPIFLSRPVSGLANLFNDPLSEVPCPKLCDALDIHVYGSTVPLPHTMDAYCSSSKSFCFSKFFYIQVKFTFLANIF